MAIFTDLPFPLAFIALALMALVVIGYSGLKLAESHGTDVRVVWYLFSLASVTTVIAAAWACGVGAIDNQGVFKGELGAVVNALLKFMLDLDTDVKIFSAILAVVLLPQIFSYLLSGLFGCASAPIFVGQAISFFVWSVVKSFVVAAGIFLSVALYGYFNSWNGWSAKGAASMSSMSGFLLMLSFTMLYLYRDIHASVGKSTPNRFPRLQRMNARLKGWLTRKAQ